eukprot:TRINITY_DN513_c0_g1_i1.p1 TRINITY_DN513_c0_g1~~TRINITY_DN513_c0_g1_i1.p1  ORF type:complete len:333 (+),score=50.46 TRINITY_DN513_c0_g1_i1:17-1015(+)
MSSYSSVSSRSHSRSSSSSRSPSRSGGRSRRGYRSRTPKRGYRDRSESSSSGRRGRRYDSRSPRRDRRGRRYDDRDRRGGRRYDSRSPRREERSYRRRSRSDSRERVRYNDRNQRYRNHYDREREKTFNSRKEALNLPDMPELFAILEGTVVNVTSFGAFVSFPGYSQQGLIHISQMSKSHVDNPSDIVSVNDKVWVKVIKREEEYGKKKLSLSMKTVSQRDGSDSDPNNIEIIESNTKKRQRVLKETGQHYAQVEKVKIQCGKCGEYGHLTIDCYVAHGQKYSTLIPDIEEERLLEEYAEKKRKKKEKKKRKKRKLKREERKERKKRRKLE